MCLKWHFGNSINLKLEEGLGGERFTNSQAPEPESSRSEFNGTVSSIASLQQVKFLLFEATVPMDTGLY